MRSLAEECRFAAPGEIEPPSAALPGAVSCDLTVGLEGLRATGTAGALLAWPAHEIGQVIREGYVIRVVNAFDGSIIALRRFARRTDELEIALRRARADALATLMAPPGKGPMDSFEGAGECPGLLYRYDDALRWVPDDGDCCARLYAELTGAQFDPGSYELVLSGPFGETRIGGLRRVTRELASETSRRSEDARSHFADTLEAAGLPWRNEAQAGMIHACVPFVATPDHVAEIERTEIICDERREYWKRMTNTIERLVLNPLNDGLRLVALCPARQGELYENLSETDHASFVFEDAGQVVRAWTEVGFRREPIFGGEEIDRDPAVALAKVLPSLREARSGLRARVIHDRPDRWAEELFG